jgi:hypothetical protein
VVVLVYPSAQLATVIVRALGRRPDRDDSSARALDPAPLVARHGSFDLETLLVGVIKSVVNFLLWMFKVHAVSTVGVVFPFVNGPAARSATTSRIVGF